MLPPLTPLPTIPFLHDQVQRQTRRLRQVCINDATSQAWGLQICGADISHHEPRSVPSSGQTTPEPPSLHLPAPLRAAQLYLHFHAFLHFHQFSSGRPCWVKSWLWLSACFLGGCGPRCLGPLCHGEGALLVIRGFLGTNLGSRWHGQPSAGWAASCLGFSGALVFWLWGLSWGPSFFFWGANSSYRYVALGLEYFGEL